MIIQLKLNRKSINELTTEDINSFDNVISAFGVPMGNGEIHISISKKLINIFEGTNIRLLIVGGAGSLYIDNNSKKLIDTGDLPNDVQNC